MIRIQTPAAIAMAATMLLAAPVHAEMMKFSADLSGTAEVPPNDSSATGNIEVTLDTEAKTVAWTYATEGLTGPLSASHIHGPAGPEENAGPMLDTSSGMEGTGEATDELIAAMSEGETYFNVHTEQHPDGEIRGQLENVE